MSAGPKRGMVLAAGLGTRMRALSETIPKPLVPLAGKPLIAYALESLERAGVDEIVVNTHHLAAQIELFLADYAARPGAPRIRISHEEERLETGGGVRQALGWLGDDAFYVLNSDAVIANCGAPALERLAEAWDGEAMDALLLLCPLARALGCGGGGDFFRDRDGRLGRRGAAATAPYMFTGVQLLHPRLFVASLPAPIRSTATTTRRSSRVACSGSSIAATCSTRARRKGWRRPRATSAADGM